MSYEEFQRHLAEYAEFIAAPDRDPEKLAKAAKAMQALWDAIRTVQPGEEHGD
jgi:hypothetical protein